MRTLAEAIQNTSDYGYFGDETFKSWFIGIGQHRDSEVLDRSNFRVAVQRLTEQCGPEVDDPEFDDSGWTILRDSHWAVGWVEHIYVQPGSLAYDLMTQWKDDLEDYPVLDESDWSELEWEEEEASDICHDCKQWMEYKRCDRCDPPEPFWGALDLDDVLIPETVRCARHRSSHAPSQPLLEFSETWKEQVENGPVSCPICLDDPVENLTLEMPL